MNSVIAYMYLELSLHDTDTFNKKIKANNIINIKLNKNVYMLIFHINQDKIDDLKYF